MLNPSQLGRKIANARKALGFSQSELAQRLGVSRASISLYESGNGQPSYQALVKLADVLGPLFSQSVGLLDVSESQPLAPFIQPAPVVQQYEPQMLLARIEEQQIQIKDLQNQVGRLNAQLDLLVKMLSEQRQ